MTEFKNFVREVVSRQPAITLQSFSEDGLIAYVTCTDGLLNQYMTLWASQVNSMTEHRFGGSVLIVSPDSRYVPTFPEPSKYPGIRVPTLQGDYREGEPKRGG